MLPGLPTVTVSRLRYGAQVIDPATYLPESTVTTTTIPGVIEEPWRANASPPRPDGLTADDTRLFACPVEVLGVAGEGTSSARRPDRLVSPSGTWQVREVVIAPAMPGIPAAWHAYCVRPDPGDESGTVIP